HYYCHLSIRLRAPHRVTLFPYTTLFRSCDASNFGSPAIARCSHVTWFRSSLLSTSTMRRGSLHSCQYLAMVSSPLLPSICMAPSDRKSTRLNSSHVKISYAVFCLKKK